VHTTLSDLLPSPHAPPTLSRLAWQDGAAKHLLCLSDVHTTLSDLKMEEGAFKEAAEELRKALGYAEEMETKNYRV
jgi:hypothetical protein